MSQLVHKTFLTSRDDLMELAIRLTRIMSHDVATMSYRHAAGCCLLDLLYLELWLLNCSFGRPM